MRKEQEQSINGVKFKVTQLGFADGMELLTKLGHLIGPSLKNHHNPSLTEMIDPTLKDRPQGPSPIAMIGDIISRLSFSELFYTCELLAKNTRIEREPGRWPVLEPEVDLAGRYDLATRWLAFALEVNYGDFFGEGALLSGVINRAALSPQ